MIKLHPCGCFVLASTKMRFCLIEKPAAHQVERCPPISQYPRIPKQNSGMLIQSWRISFVFCLSCFSCFSSHCHLLSQSRPPHPQKFLTSLCPACHPPPQRPTPETIAVPARRRVKNKRWAGSRSAGSKGGIGPFQVVVEDSVIHIWNISKSVSVKSELGTELARKITWLLTAACLAHIGIVTTCRVAQRISIATVHPWIAMNSTMLCLIKLMAWNLTQSDTYITMLASIPGLSGCHFVCVWNSCGSASLASHIWLAMSESSYFLAIWARVSQRLDPKLEFLVFDLNFLYKSPFFQSPLQDDHSSSSTCNLSDPNAHDESRR